MLTQNRGIWTYLNYLDPFLLQAAVFLSLFDLLWFVGAQHLEVQMAQAAGAKSIIVFDEKMSKAPLEQQNKSGTLSGQDRHWLFGFGALQHVLRCLWCWRCFCSLWQNTHKHHKQLGRTVFHGQGSKQPATGNLDPVKTHKDWPRDQQGHRDLPGSAIAQGWAWLQITQQGQCQWLSQWFLIL